MSGKIQIILGIGIMKMNKQLTQQNLDELMRQTLLNILSAKRIIYTYYKNKQLTKRENNATIRSMATNSTSK